MIIVRINGGLGNQLFQYAAGRAVALRAGLPLKLDISEFSRDPRRKYRLHLFNIVEEMATDQEVVSFLPPRFSLAWIARQVQRRILPYHRRPLLVERNRGYEPDLLRVRHSAYLLGYWQSEQYFVDVADQIRRDFVLRPAPSEANRALLEQMAASQPVCLHVRRGDYASDPATRNHHGLLSQEYYRAALQRIGERVSNPHVYVFSDEIDWARENLALPYPATYVEHNGEEQDYEDLRLMSHCRYHVIANSSFSWWGAWLADFPDKLVIAPQRWFADPNTVTGNRYPPSWIVL